MKASQKFAKNITQRITAILVVFLISALIPAAAFSQDAVIRTFTLENAEVKNAMTQVRSLLGVKNVAAVEDLNQITLRDDVATIEAATKLIAMIDHAPGEVVVDMEIFLLDESTKNRIGTLPQDASADELSGLREHARSLATPSLRLLDGRREQIRRMSEHTRFSGEATASYLKVGYDITVEARIHPESKATTLRTSVLLSDARSGRDGQGPIADSGTMTSEFRVDAGRSVVLRDLFTAESNSLLAESFDLAAGGEVVLVMTPRITRAPSLTQSDLESICLHADGRVESCK